VACVVLNRSRAMHPVFFDAKRAFLSSVAVTRKMLRSIAPGMTAARYDMMFVIAHRPRRQTHFSAARPAVRQFKVREALGVSAAVVSRMIRSLVELGWVRREQRNDRRQRWLKLTDEGRKQLRAAFRQVARFAKRLVPRVLCGDRHRSRIARAAAIHNSRNLLGRFRAGCGDTAELWFHPPSPDRVDKN
jgi:DNA-binding MarR family transcriptional regulator